MRNVRLAPAEPFRRATFVSACLCGVLAAAGPPCTAAPGAERLVQNAWSEWCQGDRTDVSEQKLSGCLGSSGEMRHKWLSARCSMKCQTLQLNWQWQGSVWDGQLCHLCCLFSTNCCSVTWMAVQVATETQCQLHAHHHYQLPTYFRDWWCSHHSSLLSGSVPVVSTAGHTFHVAKKALLHSR